MKNEQVYKEVESKSLPLIKCFSEDLTEIDKRTILENKRQYPFLHFTGENGTYLIILAPIEEYPAKGEDIKYLFGHADRIHILGDKVRHIEWCVKESSKREVVLYFDGTKVREVSEGEVLNIIYDYERNLKNQFYAE